MLRATYAARAGALGAALARHLPEGRARAADGGYYVWLRLPGVDTSSRLEAAHAAGVGYVPGARFAPDGADLSEYARLCVAYYDAPELEEGVRRLATVFGGGPDGGTGRGGAALESASDSTTGKAHAP
jgi:2-aminoadipate transaminase